MSMWSYKGNNLTATQVNNAQGEELLRQKLRIAGLAECSQCGVITDDYFILGDSISAKRILCQKCHNT